MALNSELTLQDYWRIIRRRKTLFLATWGLVVAATWVFTELQTPIYRAQTVLKIDPSPSIEGMGSQSQFDPWTLMNTEVKSIKSTAVAAKAARMLGWIGDETSKD